MIEVININQTYIVQRGDSLYSIAKKFGINVNDLYNYNNLKTNVLQIGQRLVIPSTEDRTYTVKKGDTLYGISNQFGVSAKDLANYNNINNATIQIGQVLKIPNVSGTNPSGMFIYTVKNGDSLYNIARRYNTTVDEIMKLNGLTNINLYIGQNLRIPESGESVSTLPSYINYVVQKGDSLYSIARKYNLTVNEIIKDNNLNSNNLSIGQNLKIRTSPSSNIVIEECFGEDYTPPTTSITYTVKKGDSLYSIAKKYNTSVDNIKRKNNLTSNSLAIGQVLKI